VLVKLNMLVIGFFRLLLRLTGDEMSFDTLLERAFSIIELNHFINGYYLKSRALPSKIKVRDKVRDNDLTLVYCQSTIGLRSVS
jgi:hypothetical protein